MQKYEENLAANTSGALRPLSGASVVVTDQATGLPAALYSDNGVTVLEQPLLTDNDGYFGFYAADGKYTLTFTGPRFTEFVREIVLEDPLDDPYATLAQLAAPTGSSLVRHGDKSLKEVLEALGYTLPFATATVLGGIKLGANLTADGGGVVSVGLTNGAVVSRLASLATAARVHTFPDKSGTVAMTSDLPTDISAWVLLGEWGTTGGPASIDLPNVLPAGSVYDAIFVQINNVSPVTAGGTLQARLNIDGAELATASYYRSGGDGIVAAAANQMPISSSAASGYSSYQLMISNLTSTNAFKPTAITGMYSDSSTPPAVRLVNAVGGASTPAGRMTGLKLFWSNGSTFVDLGASKVRIYGLKR